MNTRSERCLSDHALDRLLTGELKGGAEETHLSTCSSCRAHLDAFREDAARFAAEIPIVEEARAVERKLRARSIRRTLLSVGSIAAVVLVALVAIPNEPVVRTKGGLALEVIAKHEDGKVEQLLPGAKLMPGDAIRFRVASEEGGYVAIAGLDSAQVVSIYHAPVKVEGSKERLLEGSIILDSTLGPEQIAAIVCPEPTAAEKVVELGRAALDRAGGNPARVESLDIECTQAFFLIEKVQK